MALPKTYVTRRGVKWERRKEGRRKEGEEVKEIGMVEREEKKKNRERGGKKESGYIDSYEEKKRTKLNERRTEVSVHTLYPLFFLVIPFIFNFLHIYYIT